MFFHIFNNRKKYRIVVFGLKNAFLCKFLDAKEVSPRKWTDLLKGFGYWEGNISDLSIFAVSVFFDYSKANFDFRQ